MLGDREALALEILEVEPFGLGGHGHHAHREDEQIHLEPHGAAQRRVLEVHGHPAPRCVGDARDPRAGEHEAGIFLGRLVEVLGLARRLHVAVDDVDGRLGALRADVGGLLEGHERGHVSAVLDVVRILGAIA